MIADLIVVPARFASTRLPGKPLLRLAGRTLLERVVENARAAAAELGNCHVLVATDDDRIAAHAEETGVAVALTAADLDSGTVRAAAAAAQCAQRPARVINLQGDAPFVPSGIVCQLMRTLRQGAAAVATPVSQLDWERLDRLREHKRTAPFSGTTCVRAEDGRALWFSKTIIPALRNEAALRREALSPVWQHLGLYGFTMDALEWFASASPGHYEVLEGLEQLRFLEGGWRIDTVPVDMPAHHLSGIDTPEDLAKAERALADSATAMPASLPSSSPSPA
ncbi:3-deoxy-manno-octulosonate cytidylyltransferase [Novosphingobium sp. B1]|uniref:3-deoxy-manno-octulosonate cytidylyltransferase n=1 Tax=Novosphingobium sp. B1 TaxID=1938756 RepID=UPI0009D80764|nr:3-deoxy-manno-octulosonate cytidylyltransferase [Novosphingobium sp. B1]SMD04041.1 3-deoxy-manno-octulosonate cytidylyltransferase (CMP-KDO synthetase) [Novosphingobium sp. B1]